MLAHDVRRAEPYEHLKGNYGSQYPIQLAHDRNEVQLDRRRRQHQQKREHRNRFDENRDTTIFHQAPENSHELGQVGDEPAHLHRWKKVHAQELPEHEVILDDLNQLAFAVDLFGVFEHHVVWAHPDNQLNADGDDDYRTNYSEDRKDQVRLNLGR